MEIGRRIAGVGAPRSARGRHVESVEIDRIARPETRFGHMQAQRRQIGAGMSGHALSIQWRPFFGSITRFNRLL